MGLNDIESLLVHLFLLFSGKLFYDSVGLTHRLFVMKFTFQDGKRNVTPLGGNTKQKHLV